MKIHGRTAPPLPMSMLAVTVKKINKIGISRKINNTNDINSK